MPLPLRAQGPVPATLFISLQGRQHWTNYQYIASTSNSRKSIPQASSVGRSSNRTMVRMTGSWTQFRSLLIGFREVVLASEMKDNLRGPESILQWVFRIYDINGEGNIKCKDIPSILQQILR
ncbi:Hypothetical protein FKW44_012622 [Caligus rogercresseyi]|uniref:EF-hand domain-containing protein n=1 Tax=Caligus rogercresseyi TaxID=217165 RepID=A0A7T8HKR5_CALRO|nr:Hypothetical protein FKW44_012622 [Caligus rogercresseyi]